MNSTKVSHVLPESSIRWDAGPLLDIAPDDLALDLCDGYKALAQAALAALHRATEKHRQQQDQIRRLVGELRTLRAFLMDRDRAA
jgi:hypothetical protein